MNAMRSRTMIRKTSLLRKINPMMRRSSFTKKIIYNLLILRVLPRKRRKRRNDLEIMNWIPQIALQTQNSDQSPLYDVRNPARASCKGHNVRSDVSRTMFSGDALWSGARPVVAPRFLRGRATRNPKGEAWWSQTGSNRRPHACKARALPAELWPRTRRRMLRTRSRWWAWEDLNFRPHAYQARALTN